MICFLALIVFGILAIFSATFRPLAKEAFVCVFKKIRLKPCDTGLDTRIKTTLTGKLMNKNPRLAKFTFRNFQIISWIFTLLMLLSFVYAAYGGYNYYLYGNCNGPNNDNFCIFDPLGKNNGVSAIPTDASCSLDHNTSKSLSLINVNLSLFPSINAGSKNTVVFIGCYACPYTRKSYPEIRKLAERYDVNFIFAHIPIKDNTYFISDIVNCINKVDKKKFMEFNDEVFASENPEIESEEAIYSIIEKIGLNKENIKQCVNEESIKKLTLAQVKEIQKTGIYGTPTVFVNGEAVVGPKPYRVYQRPLK